MACFFNLHIVGKEGGAYSSRGGEGVPYWCEESHPHQLHHLPGIHLQPHLMWREGYTQVPGGE